MILYFLTPLSFSRLSLQFPRSAYFSLSLPFPNFLPSPVFSWFSFFLILLYLDFSFTPYLSQNIAAVGGGSSLVLFTFPSWSRVNSDYCQRMRKWREVVIEPQNITGRRLTLTWEAAALSPSFPNNRVMFMPKSDQSVFIGGGRTDFVLHVNDVSSTAASHQKTFICFGRWWQRVWFSSRTRDPATPDADRWTSPLSLETFSPR